MKSFPTRRQSCTTDTFINEVRTMEFNVEKENFTMAYLIVEILYIKQSST